MSEKINKDTCWYNKKFLYKKMNDSIKNHQPLIEIEHGKVLIELINMIDNYGLKFIDVGTGGALSNTIVKKSKFYGCDLSHVIENISKHNFPHLDYIPADIIEDDLSFIKEFDIVLLNAIIDIMESPLEILDKILKNCNKYVIIHRQDITNVFLKNGFHLTEQESYGGFTYHTILEKKQYMMIVKDNKFSIIKELNSGLGLLDNYSFLLRKNEIC